MTSEDSLFLKRTVDKKATVEHFERLLAQYGDDFRTLDWEGAGEQRLRLSILLHLPMYCCRTRNFSLLDVGCGLGEMYNFLETNHWMKQANVKYAGVDIAGGLIQAARKKFPEADFQEKDIFEEDCPSFDYVVSSGIFNTRLSDTEDYKKFVRLMIQRMWSLAKFGVAVNFQSILLLEDLPEIKERANFNKYYFYDPLEWQEFARQLTRKFVIRHDYHPSDFTVFLIKNYGEG